MTQESEAWARIEDAARGLARAILEYWRGQALPGLAVDALVGPVGDVVIDLVQDLFNLRIVAAAAERWQETGAIDLTTWLQVVESVVDDNG
jgi:hypothetical protein